jgi:hypothetical protein
MSLVMYGTAYLIHFITVTHTYIGIYIAYKLIYKQFPFRISRNAKMTEHKGLKMI